MPRKPSAKKSPRRNYPPGKTPSSQKPKTQPIVVSPFSASLNLRWKNRRRSVDGLSWNPGQWSELSTAEKQSNELILAAFFGREPRQFGCLAEEVDLKNEDDICTAE